MSEYDASLVISSETRDRLKENMEKSETYDDWIQKALDELEGGE